MVQDSDKNEVSPQEALDETHENADAGEESRVEDAEEVEVVEEPAAESVVEETPPEPAEQTPEPASAAPEEEKRKGFGLFSVLLIGLVAAVIGFVAAFYIPRSYLPDWWPSIATATDIETLDGKLAEQAAAFEAQVATLTEQLTGLEARIGEAPPDFSGEIAALADQIGAMGGLEGTVSSLAGDVETLAGQIAEIAARPVEGDADSAPAAAVAALQGEIDRLSAALSDVQTTVQTPVVDTEALSALQSSLQAQLEENAALAARVEEIANAADSVTTSASAAATLSQVQSALDRGTPFAASLNTLAETVGAEIPEALSAVAEDGVPTLPTLEREFPAAARNALAASTRATMGDGAMDRVGAFLQSQLQPRALEPREGDTPNAILSRAEAAVRSGEINVALEEIAALPEAGKAAMADWVSAATARQSALDAVATLSQSLNN